MLKLVRLLPKMFTKSHCLNLAAKISAVNLLNSGVVIYLSWLRILFQNSLIFVYKSNFHNSNNSENRQINWNNGNSGNNNDSNDDKSKNISSNNSITDESLKVIISITIMV